MAIDVTVTHLSGSKKDQVETCRGLPVWLGRSEKCQIRFDPEVDTRVSGVHAELRPGEEGGVTIVDLGSKNGVILNGTKVEGTVAVPNRAVVEIGAGGPRLRLEFAEGGGVSFNRVRRDTARRMDKDEVDSPKRPLTSTDDGFVAYNMEDLDEGRSASDKFELNPIVLGVSLLIVSVLIGMLVYVLKL
jgi:hypothetical protein